MTDDVKRKSFLTSLRRLALPVLCVCAILCTLAFGQRAEDGPVRMVCQSLRVSGDGAGVIELKGVKGSLVGSGSDASGRWELDGDGLRVISPDGSATAAIRWHGQDSLSILLTSATGQTREVEIRSNRRLGAAVSLRGPEGMVQFDDGVLTHIPHRIEGEPLLKPWRIMSRSTDGPQLALDDGVQKSSLSDHRLEVDRVFEHLPAVPGSLLWFGRKPKGGGKLRMGHWVLNDREEWINLPLVLFENAKSGGMFSLMNIVGDPAVRMGSFLADEVRIGQANMTHGNPASENACLQKTATIEVRASERGAVRRWIPQFPHGHGTDSARRFELANGRK